MESIAPTLSLLLEIRFCLESGEPVSFGLNRFISTNKTDLQKQVVRYFELNQKTQMTTHQKCLFSLIERGLAGASIHAQLCELEREIVLASNEQLESFISLLPIKALMPLLLLLFPSFLILLLGPILAQLVSSL